MIRSRLWEICSSIASLYALQPHSALKWNVYKIYFNLLIWQTQRTWMNLIIYSRYYWQAADSTLKLPTLFAHFNIIILSTVRTSSRRFHVTGYILILSTCIRNSYLNNNIEWTTVTIVDRQTHELNAIFITLSIWQWRLNSTGIILFVGMWFWLLFIVIIRKYYALYRCRLRRRFKNQKILYLWFQTFRVCRFVVACNSDKNYGGDFHFWEILSIYIFVVFLYDYVYNLY